MQCIFSYMYEMVGERIDGPFPDLKSDCRNIWSVQRFNKSILYIIIMLLIKKIQSSLETKKQHKNNFNTDSCYLRASYT